MTRILMVDGEHLAMAAIQTSLARQGCEWEAVSGDGALMKAQDLQPDLILIGVPESAAATALPSFETCRQLKNHPTTEGIPIVFLTGGPPRPETVLQSVDLGASDFIGLQAAHPEETLGKLQGLLHLKQRLNQAQELAEQLTTLNEELYNRNLQVEKELYVARQLQQSLLPPFLPDDTPPEGEDFTRFSKTHYRNEHLKISGVYLPCDALGGDLYDVIPFRHPQEADVIGVSMVDVSGHGVPAGFVTAIFKAAFYRLTHQDTRPDQVLFHLNNELANIVTTGEYVTGVYGRIMDNHRVFEYSGAGHPYPLFYKAVEDRLYRLEENATPLVWVPNMTYPVGRIPLAAGDKILLFTDGVSEMKDATQALFGEPALERLFLTLVRDEDETPLLDRMIAHLSDFTQGHPLEDDLSLVLVEVLG